MEINAPIRYLPRPLDRALRRWAPARLQEWWLYHEHRRLKDARVRLHTNTCGDFMLLSSEQWHRLRGYPELKLFSMHLDSLFCYMAYYAGLREQILREPMRIYHIDHSSGWTPEIAHDPRAWTGVLDPSVVPQLTLEQFDDWILEMRQGNQPKIFNDDNWGLIDHDLEEVDPVEEARSSSASFS